MCGLYNSMIDYSSLVRKKKAIEHGFLISLHEDSTAASTAVIHLAVILHIQYSSKNLHASEIAREFVL